MRACGASFVGPAAARRRPGGFTSALGEEAQVDYGEGPMVRDADSGKYRRTLKSPPSGRLRARRMGRAGTLPVDEAGRHPGARDTEGRTGRPDQTVDVLANAAALNASAQSSAGPGPGYGTTRRRDRPEAEARAGLFRILARPYRRPHEATAERVLRPPFQGSVIARWSRRGALLGTHLPTRGPAGVVVPGRGPSGRSTGQAPGHFAERLSALTTALRRHRRGRQCGHG